MLLESLNISLSTYLYRAANNVQRPLDNIFEKRAKRSVKKLICFYDEIMKNLGSLGVVVKKGTLGVQFASKK